MKFAAFGRTNWLYDSILCACNAGHELVLLGTCPASPEYTVTEDDFLDLARQFRCSYFCDSRINQTKYIAMVQNSGAEVAISINWLTLIKQKMLEQFKYGIINAHAGDLPRYRGNACPNWAILMGEEKVVLTLHQMIEELDAGPILLKKDFPLTSQTYITDVYQFLNKTVPPAFLEAIEGLESGALAPQPQPTDPALSLRCFPRMPEDSEMNWDQPAENIVRLVRASAEPFAGAYSFLDSTKIIVWKARAESLPYPWLGVPGQVVEIRRDSGEVAVLAQSGIVVLEEIEVETLNRCQPFICLNSTRMRLRPSIYFRQ